MQVFVHSHCASSRFTVSFAYELASSTSNSWTPTADELQFLIDHLRAQAQLNENYAREERCLAAVLNATRAYDPTSAVVRWCL